METAQEMKPTPGKLGSGKGGSFLFMHRWEKLLEKERPRALSCMRARKTVGKKAKGKGGTHAPKTSGIYRGHPWAISRFGENGAILLSARCVARGGERKPLLIAS